MAQIDIQLNCQMCPWKVTGTVTASQADSLAEVLKFVQQRAATHTNHGMTGSWQIKYSPK
ncbi:MAG: hypothetical protein V1849_03695 [Chloroflexota bacterium]